MSPEEQLIQFQPLQSAVDLSFWAEFTTLKLQSLRLSEEPLPIQGFYGPSNHTELPTPLQLDSQSLDADALCNKARTGVQGVFRNFNTLEGFKTADRPGLLKGCARSIWENIRSGAAEEDPALLLRFLLLGHAELKSYKYYYWFAFPALKPPTGFTWQPCQTLHQALGGERALQVAKAAGRWYEDQVVRPAFWLVEMGEVPAMLPLTSWKECEGREVVVAMADASNLPGNPSWPLRNLLLMAAFRWGVTRLKVVCWRSRGGRLCPERSLWLDIGLPALPEGWGADPEFVPDAVGWEANARQKTGPRMADLAASMDPARLAESAADLNIRLMKWRAAPALDIDALASTRCLLLGAGTLGCAVARTLLGWGVRSITLLDSSRVSYSNPVRQSLYEFSDCLGGGAPKAAAAAAKLRAIFPSVDANAVEMTIPMPGHALTETELPEAEASAARLEELVKGHDALFLLMDTRESRWLPTLLCAVHNKLAVNAALGFDSYLVMRHGRGPSTAEKEEGLPPRLGCYYCNDVVAPLDSTLDRTLDQQCTVARPGLAPIAGALAVEMMAAVVQHPLGVAAPPAGAALQGSASQSGLPLGAAPHMLRGQLGSFSQTTFTGQAFSQCTACSKTVVEQYRSQGWSWLKQALQEPKMLEDLTGLTELMNSAAMKAAEFDEESGDDFEDDDEEFVNL